MDDKVMAVLDAYHERIRDEDRRRREAFATGDRGGSLDDVLLAVGPDTGQLINILARSLKAPNILEIGTSFGYSGIWLADAARASGGRLTTMELAEHKSAHAREMSAKAGLADYVDFRLGDAVQLIGEIPFGIDFVLLDLWKDLYTPCLEAFYPKLNPGAIIVADNITRPGGEDVLRYVRAVRAKPHISSIMVPVGSGLEISRFQPA
ncbi:MAG TPA: class I SAM-dependent methyltransferase [Caulobacteraceae bacterium]|jgi:predicted O-methyltransferase YrrM|nr:class I SAM-dependent methyltransferase [Caulobacteraceae bacterium]